MIDGSILTSNSSVWLLLRKLYGTTFNSEQGFFLQRCSGHCMACSPGTLVALKRGTIFSSKMIRRDGRVWSCHLGFSLKGKLSIEICTGQPFWVPSRFVLLSTIPFLFVPVYSVGCSRIKSSDLVPFDSTRLNRWSQVWQTADHRCAEASHLLGEPAHCWGGGGACTLLWGQGGWTLPGSLDTAGGVIFSRQCWSYPTGRAALVSLKSWVLVHFCKPITSILSACLTQRKL